MAYTYQYNVFSNKLDLVNTGSGGVLIETPTGTVNGINLIFTVAHTPLYIVADDAIRFEVGGGYSYAGGTITMSASIPPTVYIKSFYSS